MAKAETKNKKTAIVEVPLAEPLENVYCARHVQVHLSHDQALMMRRLQDGLDASGATLESGRRVTAAPHVIQWVLENVKA